MIATAFVLLALGQDTIATVGDTVWAVRRLVVPAGVLLRPRPARPAGPVEPLGPPELMLVDGEVTVRYPLVAWEPGRHSVTLPGAILVRDDGWSDTLPDWTASVVVGSVLPDLPRDSLPVQPPANLVARTARSPWPVLLLVALVMAVLVPLHWAWRRRGTASSLARRKASAPAASQLISWADRGELRAAAEGWRLRLQGGGRSRDPVLDALVEELSAARYGPRSAAELAELCRRAASAAGEVAE